MRKTMRRSAGISACAAAVSFCSATAHDTASTTEPNSTMAPSPISLTMRPWCLASSGSMTSARSLRIAARVLVSSLSMSRE